MQRILPVICIGCISLLTACQPAQEKQMREAITYVAVSYPAATLQDVYKTCYQDFFGSEHMLPDSASAAQYLQHELATCAEDTMLMPSVEPTGWRHRYERISLQNILDGKLSSEDLINAFLQASQSKAAGDSADWAVEWRTLEKLSLEIRPNWTDSSLQAELRICADSCYAVRHSDSFRNTYHPHYRIAPAN